MSISWRLKCIFSMIKSIGSTWFGAIIMKVVCISEGPLLEVPQYSTWPNNAFCTTCHEYGFRTVTFVLPTVVTNSHAIRVIEQQL